MEHELTEQKCSHCHTNEGIIEVVYHDTQESTWTCLDPKCVAATTRELDDIASEMIAE